MASTKTPSPSRLNKRERRRRARRITLFLVILLVVTLGTLPLWSNWAARMCAYQLVAWSSRFRVQQVEIVGNHLLTRDQISELAAIPKNTSLFRVPVNAAKLRLEKHAWIKSAVVRRRLPDTIEIFVSEREPVAAVRSDKLLIITADSVALQPLSDNWVWDFPLLTPPYSARLKAGASVTDTCTLALLREALTLRAVSKEAWHNLSELYYSGNQMHAALSHPSVDILLGHGTSELSWAGALKLINDRNSVNLARCQSIDLRIPGKIIVAEGAAAAEDQTHG